VPFAMKWPNKIPRGVVYDSPVISLDIFATVVAHTINPIELKNSLDGVNLIPFISGENQGTPHEYLFWRKFDANNYAVRKGSGEKIVEIGEWTKLYNLNSNIGENDTLIEENDLILNQLNSQYQLWNSEMSDPIFLGLESDKQYSRLHPNRYKKQNQN